MPASGKAGSIEADDRHARMRMRDRVADGEFVYAVRTTGIFCKPSCAARPARPENVLFFDRPEDARAAGFRPCRRCNPDQARDSAIPWLTAVVRLIEEQADRPLPLERLAAVAGVSPAYLQRRFKAALGVSPKDYQAGHRLRLFKAALRSGDSVLGAVFGAGYGSPSRVYEQLDDTLGMTPSVYRAGAVGETVSYAVRETVLGAVMMAATDRGICFVEFGDDADALRARLAREFPKAVLLPTPSASRAALGDWIAALDVHLRDGGTMPHLPLDLRGTAFQLRVWRFLRSVPRGQVLSYRELAGAIGTPKAVRAAAGACAANRVAVLVPCHRVLRGDGGLGGYRWGLDRKRALLAGEQGRDPASAP